MQRNCFSPTEKILKPVTGEYSCHHTNNKEIHVLGLRIPLHLFPIETQNKILEVEAAPEEEEEDNEKYVDASSFRQSSPVHGRPSPEELSLR